MRAALGRRRTTYIPSKSKVNERLCCTSIVSLDLRRTIQSVPSRANTVLDAFKFPLNLIERKVHALKVISLLSPAEKERAGSLLYINSSVTTASLFFTNGGHYTNMNIYGGWQRDAPNASLTNNKGKVNWNRTGHDVSWVRNQHLYLFLQVAYRVASPPKKYPKAGEEQGERLFCSNICA